MPSLKMVELSVSNHVCNVVDLSLDRIKEENILRIQGYRDVNRIRPAIRKAAASAARKAEALVRPKAYYRVLDILSYSSNNLELQGGVVFENEAFGRFLKEAKQVVVFILTMGRTLDQAVIDYIENDQLLMAMFLEVAGWLGIEATTRTLAMRLKEQVRIQGLRLSSRLGPGYSYKLDGRSVTWPLEQQSTLFEIFRNDAIDVELLESCAMIPKISRSGLFGVLDAS